MTPESIRRVLEILASSGWIASASDPDEDGKSIVITASAAPARLEYIVLCEAAFRESVPELAASRFLSAAEAAIRLGDARSAERLASYGLAEQAASASDRGKLRKVFDTACEMQEEEGE